MPYWIQADLEGLIGQQAVLNIYSDGGTGYVNQTYLAEVQALSDAEVDGAIATEYPNVPLPIVQQIPIWAAATNYQVGALVVPPADNGYAFRAVQYPGVSGGVQPAWTTQYQTTVQDGTVLWVCVSKVPQLVRMASLMWGRCLSYERNPDYQRRYGESARKAAEAYTKKLVEAKRFFADILGNIKPSNVGGAFVDNANRIYVDSPGGVQNSGDLG